MSISRTVWSAAVIAVGVVLAHCSAPTNCLRFSDCGDGLTCAAGRCVPAPFTLPEGGELLPGGDAAAGSFAADGSAAPRSSDGSLEATDAAADDGGSFAGDDASGADDATAE